MKKTGTSEIADIHELFELICQAFSDAVGQDMYAYCTYVALSAVNIILSIMTMVGNILIIVSLQKESSLHPPTKLLFRCLASADFGVGLVVQPLNGSFLTALLRKNSMVCWHSLTLTYYAASALTVISLLILVLINVDRFLALSLGLRYRQVVTVRRVSVTVVSISLLVVAHSVSIYLWNSSLLYISIWPATIAALSVTILTIAYTNVLLALRHQQTQIQVHMNQQQIISNTRQLRKTMSAVIWVLVSMGACTVPLSILTAVVGTDPSSLSRLIIVCGLSGTVIFLNSTVNPVIYCWRMGNLRQAVKETIRQALCLSS